MLLRITRSRAREQKTRQPDRATNMNDVLTFIASASRRERRTIRIAIEQTVSWKRPGKGVCHE